MISWMQKHNKYLVWTIWVSTIAFIGAGSVGWGSLHFGRKSTSVARVGEIPISQKRLNMTYSDLYQRYAAMFPGGFDDAKAKELGLVQQAFSILETQAKLLNYAQETGVTVSDEEVAEALEKIPAFQTDGKFDKKVYLDYLSNRRIKPATFEASLRDELIIRKLLNLLELPSFPLEQETIKAALAVTDTIAYSILRPEDINVTADEKGLRDYWQQHKNDFVTPKRYRVAVVWTPGDAAHVTDDEVRAYFEANSFDYTDKEGKALSFEQAKAQATHDLRLKKSKKVAQKAYIAFKKHKRSADENITLDDNDPRLSKALWQEIASASIGDILKPKRVGERYATVRIDEVIAPRPMTYEEAKPHLLQRYLAERKKTLLQEKSQETLKTISDTAQYRAEDVTIRDIDKINGLDNQESLQFLQNLFTSSAEKGIIRVKDKFVVYAVEKQKIAIEDDNVSQQIVATTDRLKKQVFEKNLIEILDKRYPTEVYMGGLKN